MVEVLYTSGSILKHLKRLFQDPDPDDRRVAVVAYVGDGAPAYLPAPDGLHLICNPSAGGTSARALQDLIKAGARVQLSPKLHAKVFWSEQRGCIVGSANASDNALGRGRLKEAAVFLPPGLFDIDRLIAEVEPEDVTEEALSKLERETRALPAGLRGGAGTKSRRDFAAWFDSPYRNSDPWKIGPWIAVADFSRAARDQARHEYRVAEPTDYFGCADGTVERFDWLLCFKVNGGRLTEFGWLFVDFVVPVSPDDENVYDGDSPFQAVQVHPLEQCGRPPFEITQGFRRAFTQAVKGYGAKKLWQQDRESLVPPEELLKLIRQLIPAGNAQ
ncbi:phospholipase D family protein [uncultured Thiodictyon sp.]|uniref:phospholipase D family protein n=1 Tax=uncultured Thiodictyon sp. TaxID=1846217 RepID=UPI0025F533DB|nr:phospholipase D family protein [uncultured Thiodictyon sp.]